MRERCEKFGLCEECHQPNDWIKWCRLCNAKHFQDNLVLSMSQDKKKHDDFLENLANRSLDFETQIQSGIKTVYYLDWPASEQWGESWKATKIMFDEVGIDYQKLEV